uniref:Glutaredoxin-like protein n=1 Tax=Podarcis muralis TaxID=64176 RepID=A0A670JK31_PODMU
LLESQQARLQRRQLKITLLFNVQAANFKIFILQEVDITVPNCSPWFGTYKYDIPVFHLHGQFLMKHRVDIQKLEYRLLNLELQDDGSG